MDSRIMLMADKGKIITNGEIYGRTIYLAEGQSKEGFYEIPEAEYMEILHEPDEVINE